MSKITTQTQMFGPKENKIANITVEFVCKYQLEPTILFS